MARLIPVDTVWRDMNEMPYISGWHVQRSTGISESGTTTFLVLSLQDGRDGEIMQMVVPLEVAQRLAWDMAGEANGFFVDMCDHADPMPDDMFDDDDLT